MRCHQVRSLGCAYDDSELDAKTSLEIQQHLQSCSACTHHLEAEQRLDGRIDSVLRPTAKDEALWQNIEADLAETSVPASAKPKRWQPTLLAIAACLAFAFFLLNRPQKPSVENPPDLAAALSTDHAKYLAGSMPPQFTNEPPAEILAKTNGRLDRAAFHLLPPAADFTPDGKRLCNINGVPIAWVMGRADGQPVSVVVLRQEELATFPELAARFHRNEPIACFESGGFTFAARRVADHIVCLVGDLPRPRLEALTAAVTSTP